MAYVLGAVCGLIWGAAAAFLNFTISKRSIAKNSTSAILGANVLRVAVDLVALGAVFLLRRVLPFRYEATLIATALAMSMVTIVLAYRMSMDLRPKSEEKTEEEKE